MNVGALNKITNEYITVHIANKTDEYICPDCKNDLILCKGKIVRPYFRHVVDKINPCNYYSAPTESQIHKDAKYKLKTILEQNKLLLSRYCSNCNTINEFTILQSDNTTKIKIEYKFEYNDNNRFADVAYLNNNNNNIIYLFEIYHTNKTKFENRPEPWFELNATDIMNMKIKEYKLKCNRDKKCEICKKMENLKENNLVKYIEIKLGQQFRCSKCINNQCYCINKSYYMNNKSEYIKFNPNDSKQKYLNIEYNKSICEIFKDDLNGNQIVIYLHKGYIVSNENYNRYNYLKDLYTIPKHLYKYCTDIVGMSTINIIHHLIIKSKCFIPPNYCNRNKVNNIQLNYLKYCKIESNDDNIITLNNSLQIEQINYYINEIKEYYKLQQLKLQIERDIKKRNEYKQKLKYIFKLKQNRKRDKKYIKFKYKKNTIILINSKEIYNINYYINKIKEYIIKLEYIRYQERQKIYKLQKEFGFQYDLEDLLKMQENKEWRLQEQQEMKLVNKASRIDKYFTRIKK